jgi:hypothetical protein
MIALQTRGMSTTLLQSSVEVDSKTVAEMCERVIKRIKDARKQKFEEAVNRWMAKRRWVFFGRTLTRDEAIARVNTRPDFIPEILYIGCYADVQEGIAERLLLASRLAKQMRVTAQDLEAIE